MLPHSIESPNMVDPQWHTCIWYWGSKWNLHTVCWGAVGYEWSGAQPLFTLGLLMFALSLVDFLSLLLSPSIDIKTFYFCQKYHLKNTYKIFKKFHAGLKFEWGLWDPCWLSCERLPYEVFFSCLCDGLLGATYANILVTTQWPLKRAAHLTSFVWVCVVWRPISFMELSALCLVWRYGMIASFIILKKISMLRVNIPISFGIDWIIDENLIFSRGQFWPSGIVVACNCVCVSITYLSTR